MALFYPAVGFDTYICSLSSVNSGAFIELDSSLKSLVLEGAIIYVSVWLSCFEVQRTLDTWRLGVSMLCRYRLLSLRPQLPRVDYFL